MTSWSSVEIKAVTDEAPTVAFSDADVIFAPDALRSRVASAVEATGFDAKPGRWLDLIGEGGDRIVVVAVGAKDSADRWRNAGGHLVDAIRALTLKALRLPAASDLGIGDALADIIEGALLHGFRLDQGRRDPAPGQVDAALYIAEDDLALADRAQD
ncbi:MAG TPA: M17 family peptidase N-terminal domain-containing protein, partial [Sphingopyxis sp.]|nr:M17 family peptidase N-terminal domain-containing protein [Sphingopyxis sp.]